ncbi:hypothetical protein GCM10028786_28490 [Flaviaesturariibacter terrae]
MGPCACQRLLLAAAGRPTYAPPRDERTYSDSLQTASARPVPARNRAFLCALKTTEAMKFLLVVLALTALFRRLLPERSTEETDRSRTGRSGERSFGHVLGQLKALFVPK